MHGGVLTRVYTECIQPVLCLFTTEATVAYQGHARHGSSAGQKSMWRPMAQHMAFFTSASMCILFGVVAREERLAAVQTSILHEMMNPQMET